ncbi:MAG: hypothetical protein QW331_04680 [Candidatus Woesearchaeota archaeon]
MNYNNLDIVNEFYLFGLPPTEEGIALAKEYGINSAFYAITYLQNKAEKLPISERNAISGARIICESASNFGLSVIEYISIAKRFGIESLLEIEGNCAERGISAREFGKCFSMYGQNTVFEVLNQNRRDPEKTINILVDDTYKKSNRQIVEFPKPQAAKRGEKSPRALAYGGVAAE